MVLNRKYITQSHKFTDEPKLSGEQCSLARKVFLPLRKAFPQKTLIYSNSPEKVEKIQTITLHPQENSTVVNRPGVAGAVL